MLAIPDTKILCRDRFCVATTGGMLAKSADIWLLGQHVANMLATFPAKFYVGKLVVVAVYEYL
jgi:hypothetical protein